MVFQYLIAFLAGSGLTGILTTIYERHQMSRESRRAYIRELILKPEFFRYLTGLTETIEFWDELQELRQRPTTYATYINGVLTPVKSEEELFKIALPTFEKYDKLLKEVRESGVFYLVPAKVNKAINNILSGFPSLSHFEEFQSITEAQVKRYIELITELRRSLTKEMGID